MNGGVKHGLKFAAVTAAASDSFTLRHRWRCANQRVKVTPKLLRCKPLFGNFSALKIFPRQISSRRCFLNCVDTFFIISGFVASCKDFMLLRIFIKTWNERCMLKYMFIYLSKVKTCIFHWKLQVLYMILLHLNKRRAGKIYLILRSDPTKF